MAFDSLSISHELPDSLMLGPFKFGQTAGSIVETRLKEAGFKLNKPYSAYHDEVKKIFIYDQPPKERGVDPTGDDDGSR